MNELFKEVRKMNELFKKAETAGCKECPWNRFCIEPPIISEEEEYQKIEEAIELAQAEKSPLPILVAMATFRGEAHRCLACSIFIQRLKTSPRLAQKIKEIMQGWEE